MPESPPASSLWRYLPVIIIAVVAVIGLIVLRDELTFDALARHRVALLEFRDAHYMRAALGFMVAYCLLVTFSLPGATVATLTGGFLFGLFPGVLFNVAAAGTGAVLLFLAARWGPGDGLAARFDSSTGRVARLKAGLDENQWEMLFLMRLLPVVPFFLANLIPAFVGVPLFRFAVTTYLGILPGAGIYTSVGAGLGAVFESGDTPDLTVIFEPRVLLPIMGLSALAILPILLRAMRSKKEV
ncbi:MAG: VTT domain-containing protein [Celeribacter sp.]|jgi:uncharacterized membrane protein YdjX (TVP38/TMEM64 family)